MADGRDVRWEHRSLDIAPATRRGRASRNNSAGVLWHAFLHGGVDPMAWRQAVGQLGGDGWEMVIAPLPTVDGDEVGGTTILYFKRRAGEEIQQPMLANL